MLTLRSVGPKKRFRNPPQPFALRRKRFGSYGGLRKRFGSILKGYGGLRKRFGSIPKGYGGLRKRFGSIPKGCAAPKKRIFNQ